MLNLSNFNFKKMAIIGGSYFLFALIFNYLLFPLVLKKALAWVIMLL